MSSKKDLPAKSDSTLLTEAVNEHGVFFKRAARKELESVNGVNIVGEEYPIRYMKGSQLDLLAEFRAPRNHFLLPIECKRVYSALKHWVFFQAPNAKLPQLFYYFDGFNNVFVKDGEAVTDRGTYVCVEGIELRKQAKKDRPYKYDACPDPIWGASNQICLGLLGLVRAEINARSVADSFSGCDRFIIFPIVLTNAKLAVCKMADQSLELMSGNHLGDMKTVEVNWLILQHPFTPDEASGATHLNVRIDGYVAPELRGWHQKHGIVFLNASAIRRFFNMLSELSELQEGPPADKDA